jgi:acyl homoserine lactone synthase
MKYYPEVPMGTIDHVSMSRAEKIFPELEASETQEARTDSKPTDSSAVSQQKGQMRASVLSYRVMHQFGDLFVNYLKARHDVFIGQRGWNLPEIDGMEFDQYDTPLARFVVIHEFGEILAGIRLTPTTAKVGLYSYMIRDAQLGLLKDLPLDVLFFPAPVNDQIWEASRLFVSKNVASSRRGEVQRLLMTTMASAAREVGAKQVIGIVPAVFRRWLQRIGMSATPVGPEMPIDDVRTCAALFDVTTFGN